MGFQNRQQQQSDSDSDSDDEEQAISPAEAAAQMERMALLREQNRLLRIERERSDRELAEVIAERTRLHLEKNRVYKELQERRNRRN
jgi:hypothetical protein